MYRLIFFLILITFGVTFVTGSPRGAQIGLSVFGAYVAYLLIKLAIDIWLHVKKEREDQVE